MAAPLKESLVKEVSAGDPWFRIVEVGKDFKLAQTKLRFEPNGEGEDGQPQVQVSGDQGLFFFIRESTLTAGPVSMLVNIDAPAVKPAKVVKFNFGKLSGTLSSSVKIDPKNTPDLYGRSNYILTVKMKDATTTIEFRADKTGAAVISWIGDINRDGFPDLMMPNYENGVNPTFYMSVAKEGKFSYVKTVALGQ